MKAWWGRRTPFMKGVLVMLATDTAWTIMMVTVFPGIVEWSWGGRLLFTVGSGIVNVLIGNHVYNVAQTNLDLEADRKAMRDAIDRLERGG